MPPVIRNSDLRLNKEEWQMALRASARVMPSKDLAMSLSSAEGIIEIKTLQSSWKKAASIVASTPVISSFVDTVVNSAGLLVQAIQAEQCSRCTLSAKIDLAPRRTLLE